MRRSQLPTPAPCYRSLADRHAVFPAADNSATSCQETLTVVGKKTQADD